MDQFNHPESEKHISTAIGTTILVLIVIIAVLVVWRFKGASDYATMNAPVVNVPAKTKNVPAENTAVPGSTGVGTPQVVVDDNPIDFDQEIKDLDSSVSSTNSNDFGDSGLSDANLGL